MRMRTSRPAGEVCDGLVCEPGTVAATREGGAGSANDAGTALPLVIALALTKRWSLAARLLFIGSWATPSLIALVAGILGLALKPFGLVD